MALDPGIRDLLQAIEDALAQQPAADDRAQLNELASRADLVRQAVRRSLEDEPPATSATRVRVHAGLPPRPASGA
jgi:metal-responsive CopG/Arc/MetJ family transcriptional regulator